MDVKQKISLSVARKRTLDFLASGWPFLIVIMIFVAETSWLAITSAYPMAFDESYHFQLIQFFGQHLNPIITHQPTSSYVLGNIVHNPSWLYHYLLSFPYNVISHFTGSLQIQVIGLRLINIAMAVTSLVIGRKLLRQIGLHGSLTNLVLLLFALTPVITALSAQINYDNLVLLGSLTATYLCVVCVGQLQRNRLNVNVVLALVVVCLLASLVQYTFLPVFLGIILCIGWTLSRRLTSSRAGLWQMFASSFRRITLAQKAFWLGLVVVSLSLFITFYGVDFVLYKSPVPQCNQVLGIAPCQQYYSWDRNYKLAQAKASAPPQMNVALYSYLWAKTTWYQMYAEIIPTGGLIPIASGFYLPLITLTVLAAIAAISQFRKILRDYPALKLLGVMILVYTLALWARNYHDYRDLSEPVAIQGRYMAPVLIYLYTFLVLGSYLALRSKSAVLIHISKVTVVTAAVALFVIFGGYVRYASEISPEHSWPMPSRLASALIHHR